MLCRIFLNTTLLSVVVFVEIDRGRVQECAVSRQREKKPASPLDAKMPPCRNVMMTLELI